MRLYYLLIPIIALMTMFPACKSVEKVIDLPDNAEVTVALGDWEASLKKQSDGTVTGDVPKDLPMNLRVEIITKSGARYAGIYAPDTAVILPQGGMIATFSGTTDDATQQLELIGRPTTGPSGGPKMLTFDLVEAHELQQFNVRLMSIDSYEHLDDYDAYGEFVVTAASALEAHAIVQAWYASGGQNWLMNELIDDIVYAYTTTAYVEAGKGYLMIQAMNDQKMNVTGAIDYEDGTSSMLNWPKMNDREMPCWSSSVVISADLFPMGSEGILESLRFNLAQDRQESSLSFILDEVQIP